MDDQPNVKIDDQEASASRRQTEKQPERFPFIRVRGAPFRNDIPIEVDHTRTNSYRTHNYFMTKSYVVHCEPYRVLFDKIPTSKHKEVKAYCLNQERAVTALTLNEEFHKEWHDASIDPENKFFNTAWRDASYLGKAQKLGGYAASMACFTLVACASAYGACYIAYKLCAAVAYIAPAVVAIIKIPEQYLIKLGESAFRHLSGVVENSI
jgi:hypothetical protein